MKNSLHIRVLTWCPLQRMENTQLNSALQPEGIELKDIFLLPLGWHFFTSNFATSVTKSRRTEGKIQ